MFGWLVLLIIALILTTIILNYLIFYTKSPIFIKFIAGITMMAITAVSIVLPYKISENRVIGDAKLIYSSDIRHLYYDQDNDEYFLVKENLINPFNLFIRIEIDQNAAKQIADASYILDNFNSIIK